MFNGGSFYSFTTHPILPIHSTSVWAVSVQYILNIRGPLLLVTGIFAMACSYLTVAKYEKSRLSSGFFKSILGFSTCTRWTMLTHTYIIGY